MSSYSFHQGSTPLIISMPHIGVNIPNDVSALMTPQALKRVDTDWYVDKLYSFAHEFGANIIKTKISRYVIDLNRGIDGVNLYPGANSTELCPTSTFDLSPIYLHGKSPSAEEIKRRINEYWLPYHNEIKQALARTKAEFGYVILLDAHSILSEVPRFFEGKLPDFNWGTANGRSCSPLILDALKNLNYESYSVVSNERFKGGYITREYGEPKNNIHAIQLELSQRTYMNEGELIFSEDLAEQVIPYLKNIVRELIQFNPIVNSTIRSEGIK